MLSYQVNGAKIREARERRGLSVPELAEAIGITPGYLYKVETGAKQPGVKTVRALADRLQVDMTELLGAAKARQRRHRRSTKAAQPGPELERTA